MTLAVCALLILSARDAAAQVGRPWTDRGYVNLNVGFESVSGELNDATTFRQYDEDATLSIAQAIDSGSFVDISGGARVWRNVSVGLGFHGGSTHSEAAIQGSIPHPIFFNRNRSVAASVGDLTRTEHAVHLQVGYLMPINDDLSIHFLVGPSFFSLHQDTIDAVSITEVGSPFTSVNATSAVAERTDSSTGFNIGVDISYIAIESGPLKVGAGLFIRYSGASADVGLLRNEHVVDSDVGGLQIGFGGRIRF